MNNLKRFFEPISKDRWLYVRAILSALYVFGFELATVLLLQSLTAQIQQGDVETLWHYLIIFVVAVGIFTIGKWFTRDYTWVTIGAVVDNCAHGDYIKKLIEADSTAVEKIGTGRLIAIMNQGLTTRRSSLESAAFHVPEILINMGFVVYMVSRLHWAYSVIFLVLLVLVSLFSAYISTKANPWRAKKKHIDTELSRFDVRMIMSKQEIIQSGKLDHELDVYRVKNIERYKYASKVGTFLFYMYEGPVLLMKSFVVLIVLYAIYGIHSGDFSYPTFVGLVAVWGIANNSVIKFTGRFKDFTKDFVHIEKLRTTFDELPQMKGIAQGIPFIHTNGNIVLHDVCFAYAGNQPVFSSLSLSLQGGKKTALVGSSGSGKSTLIKLIAGYIRPDSG
ncbi:MAG: ABC transporter ATP-binding protein, partial [Candidatus Absconditabacterales bacterium]